MLATRQLVSVYQQPTMRLKIPLTMDEVIGSIDAEMTDVEEALLHQIGAREVPFAGMDKSGRGVCLKHVQGICTMNLVCPLRHIVGDKAVVCKHWLRGLCKKVGPYCKHRHRRRVICPNYVAGFCPDGKECKFTHPSFALPAPENCASNNKRLFNHQIICHNCHERGHKATHCPHLPNQQGKRFGAFQTSESNPITNRTVTTVQPVDLSLFPDKKSLSEVTCYKCGEKGHYANRCHKGALAFLSNTAHLAQEQREKDEREGRRVFTRSIPWTADIRASIRCIMTKKKDKDKDEKKVEGSHKRKRAGRSGHEVKAKVSKKEDGDGETRELKESYSLQLKKINAHLTCNLCKGYLIDAITVIDCLHTFCKSCLLTYFEEEDNCCPSCEQLIHQSHPSHYVAFDRTMQDIVYKLVPGLLESERKRRLDFLKDKKRWLQDESSQGTNRCFEGEPGISHHRNDEHMIVSLIPGAPDLPKPTRPIVRLSGMATVNTLKRYLAQSMWSNMSRYSELDLFCNDELMGRDFSMRFIHLTRCRNKLKDEPLKLVYRYHIDF
ncbi:zinc knuckle [Ostertagia ostertagi]